MQQLTDWNVAGDPLATEIVVSELVTNAIRHSSPPLQLRLFRNGTLTCEVSDTSPAGPLLRHARTVNEGRRGFFIMARLAQHWGTRHTVQGKTTWTERALR